MRFFSYLFYPRGLKPYTTFHYRATSSQPLLIYFNIDQRVQAVHCVLIITKVYRPKEPSSRLPWNLSKVYVPREPRYHLCNSCLKVHNIRKFAASCSLQQDMLVGDLTEDFNWSAPAVLYKFYFMRTDALQRPVFLPVRSDYYLFDYSIFFRVD